MYKKNKRNEYLYAINKRNEIITKHLIQNLINISSENPKPNDINNIDNFNINNNNEEKSVFNSSFGSQILNIKDNKNNMYLNDSNNNNNYINNNKIENNLLNSNNINFKNLNDQKKENNIFEDLKEIRNKQRSKPVIIDLNSL